MAGSPSDVEMEGQSDRITKEDLMGRLDGLLEQYLNLVDQYQNAVQNLSTLLSNGQLSLAKAQFNNTSHNRYGQDFYDDRMQALRKTTISEEDSRLKFSISSCDPGVASVKDTELMENSTNGSRSTVPSENPDEHSDEFEGIPDCKSKNLDPIRWFGILVPPALRAAQQSFISAIEGPVPELASLSKGLRNMEVEISRLRKQIKKL